VKGKPGSQYYSLIASKARYRHLQGLRVVNDWLDKNIDTYVDRAIDTALRETRNA